MPTRTTTFATNDALTANDLNSLAGAWNSYTPTVGQGATSNIAKTVTYAKYLQFGKLVIGSVSLMMTGAGTAGSRITVTTPVTSVGASLIAGSGMYLDSGSAWYPINVDFVSSTQFAFNRCDETVGSEDGFGSSAPNFAIASGDMIRFSFVYEAA